MPLNQSTSIPWTLAAPCAGGGILLIVLSVLKCAGLAQGGGVFVGVALTALVLLAVGLLFLCRRDAVLLCLCLLPIGLAIFLRAMCMDHITYDYRDFLSGWAAFFRDNGGWAAVKLPKGNYNVFYLYFLAAISYIKVPDLYLIKLFSILFDVLLAWGGLRLTALFVKPESRKPVLTFCLLLLLPTVVLNGAYWSQCDAIYGALTLHALASALEKRPGAGVVLIGLAFAVKLQTVFILPLWCALWFLKRVNFRQLLLFPAVNVAIALPALLLGKPLGDVLSIYFGQMGDYSAYLALNAPSMYAMIPYGKEVDVALWSKAGIAAAFLLVLLTLFYLYKERARVNRQMLLTAAVIFTVGIPLLLPHMHDRYWFLADVLTLCWVCLDWRKLWAVLGVQVASLGAYHAYLLLRYAFPMKWGALMLLGVLIAAWATLVRTPNQKDSG